MISEICVSVSLIYYFADFLSLYLFFFYFCFSFFLSWIFFFSFFFFFFFFGHVCSTWKFQGQGSNPCHSSDPNHSSDNTEYLTCHQETPGYCILKIQKGTGKVYSSGTYSASFSLIKQVTYILHTHTHTHTHTQIIWKLVSSHKRMYKNYCCGSVEANLTSIQEDTVLLPGFNQ